MTDFHRPLEGHVINISVSESNDSRALGFPDWQVNRVTLQLAASLFGQGATVIFGHDWRDDGVMEAVYGFARGVQSPTAVFSDKLDDSARPLLINLLPWPDDPYLPDKELERLKDTLHVESAGLPDDLKAYDEEARVAGKGTPIYRYIRARALTHLRHRLTDACDGRLCVGGRRAGSAGRYPGIIEEGLFALRAAKPMYVAGLLGGASRQIISALKGHRMPDDFCAAVEVVPLYDDPPIQNLSPATLDDRLIDREEVWDEFIKAGVRQVSEMNHLTCQEMDQLFETSSIDQIIELVLTSISRIRRS